MLCYIDGTTPVAIRAWPGSLTERHSRVKLEVYCSLTFRTLFTQLFIAFCIRSVRKPVFRFPAHDFYALGHKGDRSKTKNLHWAGFTNRLILTDVGCKIFPFPHLNIVCASKSSTRSSCWYIVNRETFKYLTSPKHKT